LIVETDVLQAGKENQSMLYHSVGFQGKQPNATATHFICRGVEEAGGWQNCDCNMSISFISCLWQSCGISPFWIFVSGIKKKGNQILTNEFLIRALYPSCCLANINSSHA